MEGQGRTALMYSCMADQVETLTALMKKGALLTAQDSNGQTALHWAAITVRVCGVCVCIDTRCVLIVCRGATRVSVC